MAVTATAPKKLYELSDIYFKFANQHLALIEEAEEAEGEITDEQLDRLAAIEDELKQVIEESQVKIVNIMRLCETRKLEIATLKAEENRLGELAGNAAAKRKRLEKNIAFFEMYSLKTLDEMGLEQVDDGVNTVKIRKSKRCNVVDLNAVNAEFIRKVTLEPDVTSMEKWMDLLASIDMVGGIIVKGEVDKTAAKKLLVEGKEVAGCELETHKALKFS